MDRPNKLSHAQAAPTERVTKRRASPATKKSSVAKSAAATKSQDARQQQPLRQLTQRRSTPAWLRSLLAVQKISMVLFVSVFGLSSIVYGYTMQTQTTWRSQQDRLKRWQNQERQQAVMNENLKQQMAQTAEQKESGLVAPKPNRMIFIHSAPLRQPKLVPNTSPSPQPTPASKLPLGY
jgi:hypothetical protein